MLIERIIFARLKQDSTLCNLVSDRIYPQAPNNTEIPYIDYSITNTATSSNNDGVSSLERHTLTINAYAITCIEVDNILSQVKTNLHGYRGGQIRLARLDSYSTAEQERGYSGTQTYQVIQDSEIISQIILITRNSDKIITLNNLTSTLSGELISDATVTAVIKDTDNNTVLSFSMAFISAGKYRYTIPAIDTATLTDATYTLIIDVTSDEGDATFSRDIRTN